MLSRWPFAKTRGPHWSSLLLRTQSSFRETYLHSAPSHLPHPTAAFAAHAGFNSLPGSQRSCMKVLVVFARSSKQIPGCYFEPRSPDQGVLYFQNVKLFAGTRLRVTYDRPHKKLYGLSCKVFHEIHIAQSRYLQIACTGFHPNWTIWKSRLDTRVPPHVKNVTTTILTTLMPARHNFVRKFYTEFDENQTSGFAAHCPGLIAVKTQIIFYGFYFRCEVCVLTDTIFVQWVTEYLIEKSHIKLFCHRYLGRRSPRNVVCIHGVYLATREMHETAARGSRRTGTYFRHRQERAGERQALST